MSEPKALYVLMAPSGQLTGNGQLRETVKERRNRKGEDVSFWYLSPELVEAFNLSSEGVEAVVTDELTSINWVKLRFGGELKQVQLDIDELRKKATSLPPEPTIKDIGIKEN